MKAQVQTQEHLKDVEQKILEGKAKFIKSMEEPKSNGELVKAAMATAKKKGTFEGMKSADVLTVIKSMGPQISQALPRHITAERIIQVATTYISNNPKIAECTAASIIGAIMQASITGLEPVPALGLVYFVPYNRNIGTRDKPHWIKEVQFQIGYKGYLRLAYNSNEIETIDAHVVRKGDVFNFELGLTPSVKHLPNQEATGDEEITFAYAVVHYKSGGYNFVVLTKNAIEKLRRRSPSQKKGIDGAWATDYEAMAKAKAIKQLSKYMPLSIEVQKAIVADESIINERAFTNNNLGIDINNLTYANEETEQSEEKDNRETDNQDWVDAYEGKTEAQGDVNAN